MVFRLSFEIEHEGCWARDASVRWPDAHFKLRLSVPVRGHARDILSVRVQDPKDLGPIAETIRSHPMVHTCVLMDSEGGTGFFLVEGRSRESLIEIITTHEGFLLGPTHIYRGKEHWTVGFAYREKAKPLLSALEPHGKVEVLGLVKDTFPDLKLTEAQRRVLRAAIAGGYYAIPRKTSPTHLAKLLGLAKSTVIEHLQKAEAKVILGAQEDI